MTTPPKVLHRLAVGLTASYVVAVAIVVFWPTPVDRAAVTSVDQILVWLHEHHIPHFVNYTSIEFAANIAMFLPLGIIASVWSRRAWAGMIIGCVISCAIELAQHLFLTARFSSYFDVLANTLGAGLGAIIYYFWHRAHTRQQQVEILALQQAALER